jgi:hypothetical protein
MLFCFVFLYSNIFIRINENKSYFENLSFGLSPSSLSTKEKVIMKTGNKENKNRTYLHKIGSYLLLKTSMCEIKITIGGWGKLN